ncbi:MAG: DUF4827 domain-containing protein [Prevotella sp.]|nr:DUF4827 domain-containing protein [Prevotella sp.]
MRKSVFAIVVVLLALVVAGCNKHETYADQKKKETAAIKKFLLDSAINVISESEFQTANYTTDVAKNQYVLFESTGVYMQIVRKGCGEPIKKGETTTVLCRFSETNLLTDSLQLTNNVLYYASIVDKMSVTNSSGTFTASFISGSSVMASAYGSTQVPAGWLVPFTYINVGRPAKEGDEIAKVRLIVPHSQGHGMATQNVYPCFYEITYEKGL